MTKQRRTFTAEEKVAILRRHLLDGAAVSDLCDEYGLHPTVFYRWQKAFFENGAAAFERRSDARGRGHGRWKRHPRAFSQTISQILRAFSACSPNWLFGS